MTSVCLRLLVVAALMFGLAARAGDSVVYSRFEFDLRRDGQHAVILDYKYSAGALTITAGDPYYTKNGSGFVFESAGFQAPRGTSLYVKWRDTNTNEVFEDLVDMNRVLPRDMKDQTIALMIDGRQLYLYLVSEKVPREPGSALVGPSVYRRNSTRQVYP